MIFFKRNEKKEVLVSSRQNYTYPAAPPETKISLRLAGWGWDGKSKNYMASFIDRCYYLSTEQLLPLKKQ